MKTSLVFLVLLMMGFAVCWALASVSGENEAWDTAGFWTIGLPALILAAGVAGYLVPARYPLWGIALVAGLDAQLLIGAGELGSLWPVGLLLSLLLGLLCVASSGFGAGIRTRRPPKADGSRLERRAP
jgi:hypothetical protein